MMADHARSTGGIDFDPDDDFNPFSEDEVGTTQTQSAKYPRTQTCPRAS